jgi:2-oxoglutarate dehydrogenase complex dehydrogenase (E1) component-like enzyme
MSAMLLTRLAVISNEIVSACVNLLQFMHSPSKTERLWFSHLLESQTLPSPEDTPLVHFDVALKKRIHELLTRSEVLDNFLQLKFPNLLRVRTSHLLVNEQ